MFIQQPPIGPMHAIICNSKAKNRPCVIFIDGFTIENLKTAYMLPTKSKEECPIWATVCFRGKKSEKGPAWPKDLKEDKK